MVNKLQMKREYFFTYDIPVTLRLNYQKSFGVDDPIPTELIATFQIHGVGVMDIAYSRIRIDSETSHSIFLADNFYGD